MPLWPSIILAFKILFSGHDQQRIPMSRITKNAHLPEVPKQPKINAHDCARRITKHIEQPGLQLPIAWNFDRMDDGGKFKCTLKALHDYIHELLRLEGKTVDELMGKEHNHPMPIAKLSKAAKARIEALNLDEQTLFQLDLKTPARLWGILEHNIFHIIWLDINHEVYISNK